LLCYGSRISEPTDKKKKAVHTVSIPGYMATDVKVMADALDMSVSKFVTLSTQAILEMIDTPDEDRVVPRIVNLAVMARRQKSLPNPAADEIEKEFLKGDKTP
jgi:hypothetical protein